MLYSRPMPERLRFYLQRRDEALAEAQKAVTDREGWLHIANEWQKLHDMLKRDLGPNPEDHRPDKGTIVPLD